MACNFFPGSCNCCTKFIKSLFLEVQDDKMLVVLPEQVFSDREKVCVCIAQPIPDFDETVKEVVFSIKGSDELFNWVTCDGEYVNPLQIRSRTVYHFAVAATSQLFRLYGPRLCGVNRTGEKVPRAVPPARKRKQKGDERENEE